MNKTIRTLASLSLFALVAFMFAFPAVVALAQDFAQPYQPLTTVPGLFEAGKATNPVAIIKGIYGLAIGIGSVIATVMIIWAGFEYMYQESITGKSQAKERITNAFLGLLVILGSYILLRTINPNLVDFNLTLEGGSGRVANLIAVQKEFDEATAKIREAQKSANQLAENIRKADAELADLHSQLDTAETPEEQAEIAKQIETLTKNKEAFALEEKFIRATGGLDLNVSSMEESLLTGSGNNIEGNIQRGLNDIAEMRAALKQAQTSNNSPKIAARLAELDTQEILFRAQASQLNTINRYQNELIDSPQDAANEIKAVGQRTAEAFTKMGKPLLVQRIQEETQRRVAAVCPKCD